MKQSFCGKQQRQGRWNHFSTSNYYTRRRRTVRVKVNFETRQSQMTFLSSTIYPSALVIITFHCMFTWLPLLLCIIQSERQRHHEQVQPCTDCPFTSEISVKREHEILIPVMRYFYFLIFVIRAWDPPFLNLQSFKVWKTLTGSGHIATAIFLTSNRFNLIVTMT